MLGISTINIELTNRCQKKCWMCGRRELEKKHPGAEIYNQDMDWRTFMAILQNIVPGMVAQLHWDGEPTLSPILKDASIALRKKGAIVCMNTNGLLLENHWKRYLHFHSITVSVIQDDSKENYEKQRRGIVNFIRQTDGNDTDCRPLLNIRALGRVPHDFMALSRGYDRINYVTRVLHSHEMSRDYQRTPTMPEIGVCLDLLHHVAIDVNGDVYPCVRFNPDGLNFLGRITESDLSEILLSETRQDMIRQHLHGNRNRVPLCNTCHFWGCPTGV